MKAGIRMNSPGILSDRAREVLKRHSYSFPLCDFINSIEVSGLASNQDNAGIGFILGKAIKNLLLRCTIARQDTQSWCQYSL